MPITKILVVSLSKQGRAPYFLPAGQLRLPVTFRPQDQSGLIVGRVRGFCVRHGAPNKNAVCRVAKLTMNVYVILLSPELLLYGGALGFALIPT